MKVIYAYWRLLLILVYVIAILPLFPRLTSAWHRNDGNLEVIHNDGVMQLPSDSSAKRARSARVALLHLDLAEQAIRLGDLDAPLLPKRRSLPRRPTMDFLHHGFL